MTYAKTRESSDFTVKQNVNFASNMNLSTVLSSSHNVQRSITVCHTAAPQIWTILNITSGSGVAVGLYAAAEWTMNMMYSQITDWQTDCKKAVALQCCTRKLFRPRTRCFAMDYCLHNSPTSPVTPLTVVASLWRSQSVIEYRCYNNFSSDVFGSAAYDI